MDRRTAARTAAKVIGVATAAIVFVAALDYFGSDGFGPAEHEVDQIAGIQSGANGGAAVHAADPQAWIVPDVDKLPDDPWGRMVRQGRDQTIHTANLIGPDAADPAMRFAGSRLSCANCHLKVGTQRFAIPFVGVYADYPQYIAREGEVGTLEDRINGCMTRSVNGRPLPVDSQEMKAFISYMKFLSDGRPIGARTIGLGTGHLPLLTRAADPKAGMAVFASQCALCHGADALGRHIGAPGDGQGYEFPPLAGPDSFNDGAGMARLIGTAEFVHAHMPAGATISQPVLTDEEAWDVAAYVISLDRPRKADLERDYPVRSEKPADTPYGPYVDGFSELQHKYGPFQPIEAKLKELQATAAKVQPASP